jgi:DNA excision repair protein ERCC-2
MKKVLKIGIRALVEHLFRSGDLNFDYFSQSRAIDGIRAHQHVQQNRPDHYQSEVSVNYCHETANYNIEFGGRIDGVMAEGKKIIVEEIKTTSQDTLKMVDPKNPVHWGQLKAYAYIWAHSCKASKIVGQLTYVNPENWKAVEFRQTFHMAELKTFFSDMIQAYLKWAEYKISWQEIRTKSVSSFEFPHDCFRPGQRQMAVAIYRTIINQRNILIQAPTGIGKTMAAIFPSIKAFGRESIGKLFYLTARTTGKVVTENVYQLLEQSGLSFKTVTLTAKDKICFCPDKSCNPEECQFAKGYYDRINEAILEALKLNRLKQGNIEAVAREFTLCPFEFSLDISQWADGIICDYNYVFDPRVFLRRYFSDAIDQHILLIDEAHNLVDRSREMFSAQIDKQTLLELGQMLKEKQKRLYQCITRLNHWFSELAKEAPQEAKEWSENEIPLELITLLTEFIQRAEKWLRLNIPSGYRETLLKQYFNVLSFLRVAEEFDDSYTICYTQKEHDVSAKLFCIDPSHRLAQMLQKSFAAVFFSATLTPIPYFRSLFGCGSDTESLILPSPFPDKNLALFRVDHISTYYRHRKNTQTVLCRLLHIFTQNKPGNYLLFFPSYAYLKMIHALYVDTNPDADVIVQTKDMSEMDRREFLNQFRSENPRTLVGFAVLGGIFGEGIDLAGNRLLGAAVIGVGLPGISLERELIRKYYEKIDSRGFEFAYQFPGINRVLQAAGRVIRTEKDRGVVLLIDQRFARHQYATLLPNHWSPIRVSNSDQLGRFLDKFWYRV